MGVLNFVPPIYWNKGMEYPMVSSFTEPIILKPAGWREDTVFYCLLLIIQKRSILFFICFMVFLEMNIHFRMIKTVELKN